MTKQREWTKEMQEKLTPAERTRLWRIAHRDDPAYRQQKRKERQRYLQKLRQDPERYQKYLERERLRCKRRRVRKKQERTDLNKICPICGEEFKAYNSNQKVCSKEECKKKNHSIQTYAAFKKKRALTYQGCFKNCVICGQKFQAKGRAICCSRECSRKRKNERAFLRTLECEPYYYRNHQKYDLNKEEDSNKFWADLYRERNSVKRIRKKFYSNRSRIR